MDPLLERYRWRGTGFLHHTLGDGLSGDERTASIPSEPTTPFENARDSVFPPSPHPATSSDPFALAPVSKKPVLTGGDVTDVPLAEFVADPFLWPGENSWHLFFEVYSRHHRPTGIIGHATSTDLVSWDYDQIVFEAEVHSSFPYVFGYGGETYLVVEQNPDGNEQPVKLYRATSFPTEWREVAEIVPARHRDDDAVVFRWDGRWWCLVGDSYKKNGIYAYHSETLEANGWTAHEDNPVVRGRPEATRPGGRPIVRDDHVVVFYQDCEARYGHQLRGYAVTDLTPETYEDRELVESPILSPSGGFGWSSGRMHHIDPWWLGDRWVCAVDGNVATPEGNHWSINIYATSG